MNATSRILSIAAALGIIAGVVALCAYLPHIHVATVVLSLLLSVLLTARRWGLAPAAAASGLGALLLDYFFLPPKGLGIDTLEHWLIFFSFIVIALLTSYFTAQAKQRTEEAIARRVEVERLDALGQALPVQGNPGAIVAASLDSLVQTFRLEAAAFYDSETGQITRSGPWASAISGDRLRDVARGSALEAESKTAAFCLPLHAGDRLAGSLAVRGSISRATFAAIVERIESRLEKASTAEKLRQAEETRRNQEVKTALLDSLVHEIKTPLSVIKMAVSSLLSKEPDPATRRELLTIIDEESDRMDFSISDVFWTARIEAGILQSGKGPHDIRPLINETLEELRHLAGNRTIAIDVSDSLPPAICDVHLIKGVLKELLTNAIKYSPADSDLTVAMMQIGGEIVTTVQDRGVGVRPEEKRRIFEKNYRGRVVAPGAGLGLAIAKTIVEAHGGTIGVESQEGMGSKFHFSLPALERKIA